MNHKLEILIRLLAVSDSIFCPVRDFHGNRRVNAWQGRRDFPSAGIPWESLGHTEGARKQAQRLLEELASAGLIEVFHPKRIKVLGVRLSMPAEEQTRALCGLPGLKNSLNMMTGIATRSTRPPRLLTDAWISERDLCPPSCQVVDFLDAEEKLLPALSRGWVAALADSQRRVSYALTGQGWQQLDETRPLPESEGQPIEQDEEARERYYDEIKTVIARLESRKPESVQEIGPCPLPASMAGLPFSGPWIPE